MVATNRHPGDHDGEHDVSWMKMRPRLRPPGNRRDQHQPESPMRVSGTRRTLEVGNKVGNTPTISSVRGPVL